MFRVSVLECAGPPALCDGFKSGRGLPHSKTLRNIAHANSIVHGTLLVCFVGRRFCLRTARRAASGLCLSGGWKSWFDISDHRWRSIFAERVQRPARPAENIAGKMAGQSSWQSRHEWHLVGGGRKRTRTNPRENSQESAEPHGQSGDD